MTQPQPTTQSLSRIAGEPSDRALVRQLLTGKTNALTTLHQRYYTRLYRIALARCRNTADAEDVASETWLRAMAHLPTYDFQSETLLPWLSRIAVNLTNDLGRRRGIVEMVSLDTPVMEQFRAYVEGQAGDMPDPYDTAEREEMQTFLWAAIAQLSDDQAEAVYLRFAGDLSIREVAEAMHKSESAIKSLLHRAMLGLRRVLLVSEGGSVRQFDFEQARESVRVETG